MAFIVPRVAILLRGDGDERRGEEIREQMSPGVAFHGCHEYLNQSVRALARREGMDRRAGGCRLNIKTRYPSDCAIYGRTGCVKCVLLSRREA